MSYDCWTFVVSDLATGQLAAMAIVCPRAQFVGRLLRSVESKPANVEHRSVRLSDWREIRHELSVGLNPGPLPRASAVHQAIAGDWSASLVTQYLYRQPIDVEHAHKVVEALHRLLKSQIEAYESARN
jgi:hypothetical protein